MDASGNVPVQQTADKMYNFGQVNTVNINNVVAAAEENKPFNEHLTKELMIAIKPYCPIAVKYLDLVKSKPDWNKMADLSNKAKEILACNYVGLIGIQLRKIMAIGKENQSANKYINYIDTCVATGKRTIQLICFALISDLWNQNKNEEHPIPDELKEPLDHFFQGWMIEMSMIEYSALLTSLFRIYKDLNITLPIPELAAFDDHFQPASEFQNALSQLHALSETPDQEKYTLKNCGDAEINLTTVLATLSFLSMYKMVSIKSIGYEEVRNNAPRYLHNYVVLGFDSKVNINTEKLNYLDEPISTDSIILYSTNYLKGINLFPFVIDLNALSFETGVKICFFSSIDMDNTSMNYCFLEDNNIQAITYYDATATGSQINDLMSDIEIRKKIRISTVFNQFKEAKDTLLGTIDLSSLSL